MASERDGVPEGRTFRVERTTDRVRVVFRREAVRVLIAVQCCISGLAMGYSFSYLLWREWMTERPHPVLVLVLGGRPPLSPVAQVLLTAASAVSFATCVIGSILVVEVLFPRVLILGTKDNTCRLRHIPGFDVLVSLADVQSVQITSFRSGRSLVGRLLIALRGRKGWLVKQTVRTCKDQEAVLRLLRPLADDLAGLLGKPVEMLGADTRP